ncbi:hypothetical protein KFL_000100500 [Klebsormidium nitens]|uniref:Fas-binding factor 1 C-terminal domain-containing protein n=1 Tax=Klebsormidium nitens TaxID=105231 RepID=A0A1Y1HIG9_KLENI|nr:hypothetical protein KFL_000100500 [Klebsormidium nitens]|eukprot:GAQ78285.1 hypothetical protein KFL_000100500 [Klebsormidium nitens]
MPPSSSFLASAPAIGGTFRKTNGSSSSASLAELAPPPLASNSKRRSNVEDTAAIDALFDDGPKQRSGNAPEKGSKGKGRQSVHLSTTDALKTDPIDNPPKKSVLKSASPALALLSSQHSVSLNAQKDDASTSRPSSSYGIRSQSSADLLNSDSEPFGKEGGKRDKPRVTFAEPVRDSWEKDELKAHGEVGPSDRSGGSGVTNPQHTGREGLAKPSVFGSLEGDSLDFLGLGSSAAAPKTGRRGRPPVSDVGTTGQLDFGGATTYAAPLLQSSQQKSLKEHPEKPTDRALPKEETTDWGDADDLLAMLPDGSGAPSKKSSSESPPRGTVQLASQQPRKLVSAFEERAGVSDSEPTVAPLPEVSGLGDSLPAAKETAAPDLGGYTPSFLNNTGRTRRAGVGLGRRPPSPLVSDTSVWTESEAQRRSMGGFRTESDAQGRSRNSGLNGTDALKRPMSADQARSGPQLGSALGGRPATADVFRDARVPPSLDSRNGVPASGYSPKADTQRAAGFAGTSRGAGAAKTSRLVNEATEEEPFLRPAETSGRRNDRAEEEFVMRPGSGGSLRGRDREGDAVEQAEHARALAALREEMAASAAKAARERELLVSLHQQELAARDRQAEEERAFSSEHQKSLDVLQKLVAQVESWTAEVQHMSEATRSDKEKMVAERAEAVRSGEAGLAARETALSAREQQTQSATQRLDLLMATLDESVKALHSGQAEERARLEKEHARLQSLQESVLAERSAAQADLAAARERLEEMRDARVREREQFLAECEAERKELAAERKALGDAKEQVCLAEAELDVRIAQHEAKVKSETEALERERLDVEKVRECALEEAHAIQRERADLEEEKAALAAEVDSVQETARHAQAQFEEAAAIRNEAALLHRDAEALHQDRVERDARWEAERLEIEKARESLLALRRSLDEERYQIAQERRSAGDEKLEAVRMAESARLLMQKAGGTGTESGERKENLPAERPSAATKKKKKYANLVRALVGGSGTLDDVLAARLGAAAGDP